MNQELAKYIIYIALVLLVIGVTIYLFGDKLTWVGKLPGDIRIEKENTKIYVPITTMILLSIVISILIRIFK